MYQINFFKDTVNAEKTPGAISQMAGYLKLLLVVSCFALLAACSTPKEIDDSASGLYEEGEDSGAYELDSELGLYPPGYDPTIPAGTLQDLQENIGDRVFFDTDSSALTSSAVEILELQARWLKHYGIGAMTIEGHADERGTREYNLALSARRANVVRDFLVGQGIGFDAIKTLSYGKERPVALCSEPRCWDKNRRSVTLVE